MTKPVASAKLLANRCFTIGSRQRLCSGKVCESVLQRRVTKKVRKNAKRYTFSCVLIVSVLRSLPPLICICVMHKPKP